jgi:SAM-dependent methyltransferase
MNGDTFNRLHGLRMENDSAGYRQEEMRARFDKLAARHETGDAPRAVSAFQLFQTPPPLAARLVAAVGLAPGARVGECSAGLGRILDALQPYKPAEVVAIEVAPQCAAELFRQNRPGVTLLQRDFLTVTPEEIGLFDAVAINPPFHMRADVRHILHARKFLRPRGKLAALCFDTPQRQKALAGLAASWEPIPAGTFGKEGTNVPTVLCTFLA